MNKLNFLFLVLINFFCNSQIITGKILSKVENKPIAYAKIGIENSEIGNITDEQGNFSLDLSKADKYSNILIEVGGFEKFSMPIQDVIKKNFQNFFLNEKVKNIDEVMISPKKMVDRNWGINTKTKSALLYYPSKSLMISRKTYDEEVFKRNNVKEAAIYFSNKKRLKIQNINVNFPFFRADDKVKFKIVFYEENNGEPDGLMDFEDILLEIDNNDIKNGTLRVDVSDKNIWMRKNFFVSLQMLSYNYEGEMGISLGIPGKAFYRKYVSKWEKIPMGFCPAINIDVKIEK